MDSACQTNIKLASWPTFQEMHYSQRFKNLILIVRTFVNRYPDYDLDII
jgi:hypothetical protein